MPLTLLVGVTADKPKRKCPKCGSRKVTKLISRIARVPRGEEDFDEDDFDAGGEDLEDLDDEDLDDWED